MDWTGWGGMARLRGVRVLLFVASVEVFQREGRGLQSPRAAGPSWAGDSCLWEHEPVVFRSSRNPWECGVVFFFFFFLSPPKQYLSGSLINFSFGCSHLPVQSFAVWYLSSKGIQRLFEFGLRHQELQNRPTDQNRTWFFEGESDFSCLA